MTHIYLIRHAQSHANAGGHAMPNAIIPITELGQQQACDLADWLDEQLGDTIDSVSVSEFIRTQHTAKPLLDKLGIDATTVDGLQEFDYLSFANVDNKSLDERIKLADDYWLAATPDFRDGGDAESFANFVQRVGKVLKHFHGFDDGNHVVFTHGLWISMLIWQLLGQPTHDNAAMQKFRQFELSIRADNCEVFLLTLSDDHPPAMTKVRTLS